MIYVTHPSEEVARQVAAHLLEKRLVACANIFPIASAYWWQGDLTSEGEWVTLLKTRSDLWQAVSEEIEAVHPYELPCIMRWEAAATPAYEAWVAEQTKQNAQA